MHEGGTDEGLLFFLFLPILPPLLQSMRECLPVVLGRASPAASWGFRLIGGRDEGLVLRVDKVGGAATLCTSNSNFRNTL